MSNLADQGFWLVVLVLMAMGAVFATGHGKKTS